MIAFSFGYGWVDSQLGASFTYFRQLLRCAHKRIVNIMKVYIKRNNIQVELIRFLKKYRLYSYLRLRGERVPEPLYVYSMFAGWQQLAANKSITIHSPDGSIPRYAAANIHHHATVTQYIYV